MDCIHEIDLSRVQELPSLTNIVRQRGCLTIQDSFDHAAFLTPVVAPRMAAQFYGFELTGHNLDSVQVALIGDNSIPKAWSETDNAWVSADEPIYYTQAEIRDRISQWLGPIQFQVALARSTAGISPAIASLKFGYLVLGDFFSYVLRWGLQHRLSQQTVDAVRFAMPQGTQLLIPDDVRQVQSVKVLIPEVKLIDAAVVGEMIETNEQLPAQPLQLQMKCTLPTDIVTGGIYQLEFSCGILIEPLPIIRSVDLQAHNESIRINETESRVLSVPFQYVQPVLITVVARYLQDANSFAHQINTELKNAGSLHLPAYDKTIHISVGKPPKTPRQEDDNLFRSTFEVYLHHVWGTVSAENVPTLLEINKALHPKETDHA